MAAYSKRRCEMEAASKAEERPDRCSVNLSSTKSPRAAGAFGVQQNELFQSSLRDLDQRGKSLGVVDGHVGEHLAVELDASLVEAIHEHGVGQYR